MGNEMSDVAGTIWTGNPSAGARGQLRGHSMERLSPGCTAVGTMRQCPACRSSTGTSVAHWAGFGLIRYATCWTIFTTGVIKGALSAMRIGDAIKVCAERLSFA